MNATVIHRMALASLSGTLPFPEIVGTLIAEGVEYYRVDYVTRQFAFYVGMGSGMSIDLWTPVPFVTLAGWTEYIDSPTNRWLNCPPGCR